MGRKAKTRKAQTQSHRKTKKTQYRIRNWREYNSSLVKRGSIEVWVSEDLLRDWKPRPSGERRRGGQVQYSEQAIECLLTVRAVFSLSLRATEGFGQSLLNLLKAEVRMPDYTTLSKRGKTLQVKLPTQAPQGSVCILMDSTGLKVYGEGEWKVRKHGASKRWVWRKLHLSINQATHEVEATLLTDAGSDDGEVGSQMLKECAKPIQCIIGDGGYDKHKFYDACHQRHIPEVVVPPRRSAHIWQHGNSSKPPLLRDQHLRCMRRVGRQRWKQHSGYHRRSLAETCIFRFKTLFGGQLAARTFAGQQVEARIKCRALNLITQLGMPVSYRLA